MATVRIRAFVLAEAGKGYAFGFGDEPGEFSEPPRFPEGYTPVVDEINYYAAERDEDVIVTLLDSRLEFSVDKRTESTPLSGDGPYYEVTFRGSISFELEEDQLDSFRQNTSKAGVDYALYFEATEGDALLYSDEGFGFLWNRNLFLSEEPWETRRPGTA